MRVLIVGCGYVGLPLAAELARQGHEVFGLRRSTASDAVLKESGVTPLHADITQPGSLSKLPRNFDWVVNCTASGGGDAEDYRRLYLQGTRNLIEWLFSTESLGVEHLDQERGRLAREILHQHETRGRAARAPTKDGASDSLPLFTDRPRVQKFIYTSSTGVYGQNDGSLVDETSPTEPTTETAGILVQTEQTLLAAARERNFPAMIIRAAGIYGPGRGYLLKQFLRGDARIEGDGGRWLNMIHRDDLIGIIIAALERGQTGTIYNAVDDEPVRQRDFFEWLAAKLGKPMPPSVPANAETNRKRGLTNKHISNQRLTQLGWPYKYPTFREGYTAELERLETAKRLGF